VKLYLLSPEEADQLTKEPIRASKNDSDDSSSIVSGGNALEVSSGDEDDSLSDTDDNDDDDDDDADIEWTHVWTAVPHACAKCPAANLACDFSQLYLP